MQMRDGVFATNRKEAWTYMRCDTTSSPFASSNRWDGPGTLRQEATQIGICASDTGDQSWLRVRLWVVPRGWQPFHVALSTHGPVSGSGQRRAIPPQGDLAR